MRACLGCRKGCMRKTACQPTPWHKPVCRSEKSAEVRVTCKTSYEHHESGIVYLGVDKTLAPLRDEPSCQRDAGSHGSAAAAARELRSQSSVPNSYKEERWRRRFIRVRHFVAPIWPLPFLAPLLDWLWALSTRGPGAGLQTTPEQLPLPNRAEGM